MFKSQFRFRKLLAAIENVVRIERALDCRHERQRWRAELGLEKVSLARADAVFAARAASQRARNERRRQPNPVHVPPNAIASRTSSSLSALARTNSAGVDEQTK